MLCAQAIASDDVTFPVVLSELRSAIHEHVERIRVLALQQLDGRCPVKTKAENESIERLRELAAKIATERDYERFTNLVKEMNQLQDGEVRKPKESAFACKIGESQAGSKA